MSLTYHLLNQDCDTEVISLARTCWGNIEADEIAQHRPNYHSQQCPKLWIGIRQDNTLIAMASGVRNWASEHLFDVGWICTLPSFRGQGHAKDMMAILASWWIKSGQTDYPHLLLSCLNENIVLYENWGFKTILRHRPEAAVMAAHAKDILDTSGHSITWATALNWEKNPFS